MAKDVLETGVFEKEFEYLKYKGAYYEGKMVDGKLVFIKSKTARERIAKANEMARLLEDHLDKSAILTEAIMKLEDKPFDALYKTLKGKRKYKPVTRKHHCVDMKIGNFVLPIVE